MASYSTIPAPAAEEPLLQEPIKKSSRKYVVLGAALASFALGALAFTAVSAKVQTKQPVSFSTQLQPCMCKDTWSNLYCTDTQYGCPSKPCNNLDSRWCEVDSTCSSAQKNHGVYWKKCDDPDPWSSCDWVESNELADAGIGEFYLGKVKSPDECIKRLLNIWDGPEGVICITDGGDGYAVVNVERSVDSDGSRKCYCQYGLDMERYGVFKPDNSGRMSCPTERSGALKVPHSYFGPFTGYLKNLE